MTTIQDVARAAGVAASTVSRYLNGQLKVSPATEAKVLEAVAELGYVPNAAGRNLARRRSGVIGFVVPEISNPYFGTIADHVVEEVERHGRLVLLCSPSIRPPAPRSTTRAKRSARYCGSNGNAVAPLEGYVSHACREHWRSYCSSFVRRIRGPDPGCGGRASRSAPYRTGLDQRYRRPCLGMHPPGRRSGDAAVRRPTSGADSVTRRVGTRVPWAAAHDGPGRTLWDAARAV